MSGRVAVVVVGDLARSPRMLNHVRELAASGREVALIGLREHALEVPPGVEVAPLRGWRRLGALGLPGAGLRMALTGCQLTGSLLRRKPAAILLQNPPSFPTLLCAWIAARLRGARVVVDWHNYGYSMLAMRAGERHPVVRILKRYEMWTGARADAHFCVSEGMKADLEQRFGIRAQVLYDRPLRRLAAARGEVLTAVCPASWTADENMAMLLDAIALLPAGAIEFHLTGNGPEYAQLEPRIQKLREAGHAIRTGFLSEADYWALIARADIGISMHRSSSGLDLAMKVVDLFSGGAPVCAFDYGECVREQIREGQTGFLFRDAACLAAALSQCMDDREMLTAMRRKVLDDWSRTWSDEWQRVAAPAIDGQGRRSNRE